MTTTEAATEISVGIVNRMMSSIDKKLNSSNLHNEVKYNNEVLNKSLKNDFDQITEILQSIIDKFYWDTYIVDSFMPLFCEDLEFCKKHNLSLSNSMKKVLKWLE